MKEIPILFSTDMVKAILQGRKTQTRRILNPQPEIRVMGGKPMKALTAFTGEDNPAAWTWKGTRWIPWPKFLVDHFCRYGKVGDILWVRETFGRNYFNNDCIIYKAGPFPEHYSPDFRDNDKKFLKDNRWKPAIHMPKENARIWLKNIGVRVEQLQNITPNDACEEGINYWNIDADAFEGGELQADFENYTWRDDPDYEDYHSPTFASCIESYRTLWEKINGQGSWNANPWVWVVEFEVLSTTGRPH